MEKSRALLTAACTTLALGAVCVFAAAQPIKLRKPPLPFPGNYDFPANAKKLETMIQNRDTAGLRRHGWFLWAGVNQPGYDGWPIWRSWYIPTQAFAPAHGAIRSVQATAPHGMSLAAFNKKNNPEINLSIPLYLIPDEVRKRHEAALKGITEAANIPDGDNFQNNGDLMLVTEPYSLAAFNDIRHKKLFEKATLQGLLNAHKTDIPQLPRRSIVLKHMYWPVKKEGLSALPIVDMANYDKPANPDTTYVGFENMERWPHAVAIDPSGKPIPPGKTADVTYLYDVRQPPSGTAPPPPLGPHTYKNAPVVPIRAFYYKKLSMAEYKAMSPYDQVLIDASFYWAYGRVFEDGDYLVAIASHVVTKEIYQWTLQTFWWHDKPNDGVYAKDRPAIPRAKGPWRHYLMASEYGVTAKPGGKDLPIAYNPYIELASHPVVTNCRNCHIRAAWPNGRYIQNPGPSALADIKPDDPIFKGLLRTDFLWTIADRAN